jgi:hypothetical protein
MPRFLRVSIGMVRAWTRFYTWRLPASTRERRFAEIESDLWEFQHDPASAGEISCALHVLVRLTTGLPDDLCWRFEQTPALGRTSRRLVGITAVALVLSAVWLFSVLRSDVLPQPPAAPMAWTQRRPGPPPPPPPPPCRPPGFTAGCTQ